MIYEFDKGHEFKRIQDNDVIDAGVFEGYCMKKDDFELFLNMWAQCRIQDN